MGLLYSFRHPLAPWNTYYSPSILLLLQMVTFGAPQVEGDLRLSSGNYHNFGILEIYWMNKWSTFCGISKGGAQAACRQLGFLDYKEYYPLYNVKDMSLNKISPDVPIAVANTFCSYKSTNSPLHILECGISVGVRYSCTHDKDMVIECKNISLWNKPYDTQVRLTGGEYLSSGILEIYLLNVWGTVCAGRFDQGAANSACRQMGYTKSMSFSTTSNSSTSISWLSGASCNSSCSCFRSCYKAAPVRNVSCEYSNFVSLNCTYDVSMRNTPGSEDRCSKVSGEWCGNKYPSLSLGIVMVIVFLVLVVAIILVVISTLFIFSAPVYEKVNVFE